MTDFDWQTALERLERIRRRIETGELDAGETQRLLATRTEALARSDAAPSGPASVEMVGFSLGATRFALLASAVSEAVRDAAVTPLPAPIGGFVGVTSHRGRAMSVIDLRALMREPAGPVPPRCDVLVLVAGELSCALATGGDIELLALGPDEILPVPEWPGADTGLLRGTAASGLRIVDGDALMARLGMPAARRAAGQG